MEPASPRIAALHTANAHRTTAAAADQVARARAALHTATDSGHVRVLRARVERPDASLAEVAASLGLTKSTYWGRLRRAVLGPETKTREPVEQEPVEHPVTFARRAGQVSPRSARAIRVGTGRTSNLGVRPVRTSRGTAR